MTVATIPLETFCAWRAWRSGLYGDSSGQEAAPSVEETVEHSGWILAPGSSAPYLALRVRNSACTREQVDRAIFEDRMLVRVKSVRGDPFLVPRSHAMTAVAAKGRRIDARIRQIGKVVPISRGEVETLAMAISELLEEGQATLADLEEGLPTGMLRSFGTEGRRAGVSGILPVAMEYLEEEGRVLLLETGNRIDAGEQAYCLTGKALPEVTAAAPDQLEVLPQVLEIYLRSFGPARFEDFVWWAGTTLNRARSAAAALESPPEEVHIEDLEPGYVAMPDDLESLLTFNPDGEPRVALAPNRDPFYLGRKILTKEFLDIETPDKVLARFRGKPAAARVLPSVISGGRIAGIWEWDAEKNEVLWSVIDPDDTGDDTGVDTGAVSDPELTRAIEKEAAWMAEFIRDELDGEIILDLREQGPYWAYGIEEIKSFW